MVLNIPLSESIPIYQSQSITFCSSFQNADIRISREPSVSPRFPHTQHSQGCGQPGEQITIPEAFLSDWNSTLGAVTSPAKVFVKEWAKLRYGVFDEHGYPGDKLYPNYYKVQGQFLHSGTSDSGIKGIWVTEDGAAECEDPASGLCVFSPQGENDLVTCSLGNIPQLASVTPGPFKAVYGGHGVELVHFQDGQGVKVTGDPDVPFNEMTFRVTCGLRISLPIEIQSDSMVLKEVTEKHFTLYALPNVDSVDSFDFVIPESMHRRDEVPKSLTRCLGRWVGEATLEIIENDFFPHYTPANLMLFNDDAFAVMLLDPYLIRMYYRVNV